MLYYLRTNSPSSSSLSSASSSSSTVRSSISFTILFLGSAFTVAKLIKQWLFAKYFRSKAVGIIPARYSSSRFEGKPLALIMGKPMIQRTWERAIQAKTLSEVIIATDDERIKTCCENFGAQVIMTSKNCSNGTVRCNEALLKSNKKFDIVVNIQGDEPLVDHDAIDGVVLSLQNSPECVSSTAVNPLPRHLRFDQNKVKCIVDRFGHAIYFSRTLIPSNKKGEYNPNFPYLLHLGLSSYDANFLKVYSSMESTPLQEEEDLEQLKIIENGFKIKVISVNHESHGVDIPEDIKRIEEIMRKNNIN